VAAEEGWLVLKAEPFRRKSSGFLEKVQWIKIPLRRFIGDPRMTTRKKFYVVWKGRKRGVFSSWKECSAQVNGFPDARYMAFESHALAEQALAGRYEDFRTGSSRAARLSRGGGDVPPPESIAVDASCKGNPGPVEYRGMQVGKGREVFRQGPVENGTNNIGEFLAIVHALVHLKQRELAWPVYSDSTQAIRWVKEKRCKTRLARSPETFEIFLLIARAEAWLQKNNYPNEVRKWKTEKWGESPADFNRK
jgi:ribonuclease HI